ncbi:MAG: hypothetical protein SVM80_04060 [Halobacteriota archaeon]|nr:hypothetical protein [Halobacteriota archaeon]
MVKEATKTGRTDLPDMKEYGKKKFTSLLFANIIVGLITFAGVIFLIPGLLHILPNISTSSLVYPQLDAELFEALAIFGLGFLAMVIYVTITGVALALSPFAVVIDDLRAIEGVKKGFRIFMDNKVDVILFCFVIFVILAILSSFGYLFNVILSQYIGWRSILFMANSAISLIIIQPLNIIWWTRFYLNISGTAESSGIGSNDAYLVE